MKNDALPGGTDVARSSEGRWKEWIIRSTAVLAVLAALSSGQWGAANLRSILEQGKVNDGWSYYQSKSIKNHLAEHMQDLTGALAADFPSTPSRESALAAYRVKMEAEAGRLTAEKEAIRKEVIAYERARDGFVERSFWFEIAFACLQVGVVLSTIASGTGKKILWIVALVAGLAGCLFVANGFGHFVRTPEYAATLNPKLGIQDPVAPSGKY
jgi:hypothetical protein